MTLNVFNVGRFTSYSNCVEWDGTNHAEILTFVRDTDPYNDSIAEVDRWQISSTSPDLVLSRPSTHPAGFSFERTIPLNGWASVVMNAGHVLVLNVVKDGSWTTTDPHGRPNDLNDLQA